MEQGNVTVIHHDTLAGYIANEHIDWTGATEDLLTTGKGTFASLDAIDFINFDTTYTDGVAEGRLQWNIEDGTLEFGLPGGDVNLQIGQEMLIRVKNEEVVQINNGEVVYASSAVGNTKYVKLANAGVHANAMKVVGVATEDIAAGSFGYIATIGLVRDFDTSAFSDGQEVYLDTTNGQIVGSAPTAPNTTVRVGIIVRPHATEGILYANISPTGYLSEISDVVVDSIAAGEFLQWDATNNRWKNSSLFNSMGEPTGFDLNDTDSVGEISFVDGTRTFSIEPKSGESDFRFWDRGEEYVKTSQEDIIITDVEGVHVIYYLSGVLTDAVNPSSYLMSTIMREEPLVSILYWNATDKELIYFGEERHGMQMDGSTHSYLHYTNGLAYMSGLGLNTISTDQDGSVDAHAQFGIDSGGVSDEDIYLSSSAVTSTVGLPIYYMLGASPRWVKDVRAGFSVRTLDGTTATRLAFNEYTGGAWQLTEESGGDFVLYHVFATTNIDNPMICIMGQNGYSTKGAAREGAAVEIHELILDEIMFPEIRPIATVIFQTKTTYANAVNARVVSTDEGDDYIDWRNEIISRVSVSTSDHGSLTGLLDVADHPGYLLIDGTRAMTGDLVLSSTGVVQFGTSANQIFASSGLLTIKVGNTNQLEFDTSFGTEAMNLGNATSNPDFNFLGSGELVLGSSNLTTTGNIEGTITTATQEIVNHDSLANYSADKHIGLSNTKRVYPGDNLQEVYDWLKSSSRDSQMGAVSTTSRRYLVRMHGAYTGNLSVDTKYVHLRDEEGVVDSGSVTHTNVWYGTTIGDGSGDSRTNAINIDSKESYLALASISTDWGKYFLMTKDVDFVSGIIPPIGNASTVFSGTFNGNGYYIKNGVIDPDPDTRSRTAMFRSTASTTTIQNLMVQNVSVVGSSVTATSSYTAILVAEVTYGTVIDNCDFIDCYVEVTHNYASQIGYAGMVAGANHGRVKNCDVIRGEVRGDILVGTELKIGGVVGYQTGGASVSELGYIDNCRCSCLVGDVAGKSAAYAFIGGIAGASIASNSGANLNYIINCKFTGEVNYKSDSSLVNIGGIVGNSYSAIERCKAACDIRASIGANSSYIGGVAGLINTTCTIDNCGADCMFDLEDNGYALYAGGGVGRANSCTISNCYSNGSVYDAGSTVIGFANWGGFLGRGSTAVVQYCRASVGVWSGASAGVRAGFVGGGTHTITECVWDTDVAGHTTAADGIEATTAELMSTTWVGTNLPTWDFSLPDRDWKQIDGFDYPKLDWE